MNVRSRLRARWPHLLMYVLLSIGGILAFFYKSPTVDQYLNDWRVVVWAAFFFFGGSFSAYGLIRGNWGGEAVGIPFLISALSVYGVVLVYAGSRPTGNNVAIVTGLIILAFSVGLIGRWLEARRMLRIARNV